MSLLNLTQIYKTAENITLEKIAGKIQRVVNISSSEITVTCRDGESKAIEPGRFVDFCYDGESWLKETEPDLSGTSASADYIIQKEIENLIVKWALVDPVNLDSCFQVCDGTEWRPGSYAETYWSPKGLTKIPNLCGYGLRAADMNKGNDPDRDDRRQTVTGQVLTGGLTVSLPNFYCKVIHEARERERTVQIGINASDLFGTLSPVGTVSSVDLINNTVTVGTALTVGQTALIIKGDCIGSFQSDAMQRIRGGIGADHFGFEIFGNNLSGVFYVGAKGGKGGSASSSCEAWNGNFDSSRSTSPNPAKTSDYETRIKNISYLPIMYVLLPSQALVNINGEIKNIDALIDKIGANSYVSQIVQNHVVDPYIYITQAVKSTATEIQCMTTSLTTIKKESKIAIDIMLSVEAFHGNMLFITRTVDGIETEIGSARNPGSRNNGMIYGGIYEEGADTSSTGINLKMQYIDSPNVDVGKIITYKIKAYSDASSTALCINRTYTDTDSAPYERATSNVRLTEIAGTPNINFGDTDVASVTEAKAGVDNTKVITPYGLRQAFNAEGSAPVYACRAWVNFDGTGTTAIRGSGNVNSTITKNATGDYTITFSIQMEDANYSVSACGNVCDGSFGSANAGILVRNQTADYIRIYTVHNDALTDFEIINVSIFR